jgi:hypothetical protein
MMKTLLTGFMGVIVLFLGGWGFGGLSGNSGTAIEAIAVERNQVASIVGAWHSFPAGMVVQFDPDGTAQFGVDPGGKAFGFEAETWMNGETLSIRFTNYDGQDDACRSATGVYQVSPAVDGAIKFLPVDDRCQMRVNILKGNPEQKDGHIFHPLR